MINALDALAVLADVAFLARPHAGLLVPEEVAVFADDACAWVVW